ncbi:MAG: UvrD-helicase domain-containing protein [Paraprevotella sp.]|nr:UvrD-helicase domain-containing protein [Paraprevotella sp.]
MAQEFLDDLNENQRKAVLYDGGPSLVIARAGSGKTRVLTYKIAYLLEQGIKPWNILALTFTNKAAREMKERIAGLVGASLSGGLWMGTFHSVFSRILRLECDKIGFSPRFTIYDQTDSRNLVKTVIREMMPDDKVYKPAVIAGHISNAKNRLILPGMYLSDSRIKTADVSAKIPLTGEIYRRYMERCKQADAMDFDDLLLYTYLLLENNPEVCHRYAEKFAFVLVDEYQDTNYAQHSIVWKLTRERQRLCVVGDDAQSIYSFRGANIDNILNFSKKYNDTKIFKLEQNYRSTQTIVSAANSLISHNNRQIHKEVFSDKEKGAPIGVYAAYSDIEEAEIVVKKIAELRRKEDMAYDDFAILYRTNAQSRTFEEALRKRGMPYRIFGGLSFYQRKEIKDVIAYCRLTVNPNDEEAFKRIVNYPVRGIGQTTVDKIVSAASVQRVSLWEVCRHPLQYGLSVNKGIMSKIRGFTDQISGFIEERDRAGAVLMMQKIVQESGIMKEIFQDNTPENMSRQENVQELLNGVQEFVSQRMEEGRLDAVSLSDFLQEVSLLSDLDEDKGDDSRKVTLMTIHSAKGLEFPVVFIVGLEENLFPNAMVGNSPRAVEEERRLFYVALTRAERYCFLTFARSRFRYGKTEFCSQSRFLQDIDSRYMEMEQDGSPLGWTTRSFSDEDMPTQGEYIHKDSREPIYGETMTSRFRSAPRVSGLKPMDAPARLKPLSDGEHRSASEASEPSNQEYGGTLKIGTRIEHERFGQGVVTGLEGSGENAKATVEFRNTGKKQLLLRFARFKVIG